MYFVEQVSDQHFLQMLWPPTAGVTIPCLWNLTKISVILARWVPPATFGNPQTSSEHFQESLAMFRSRWNVFDMVGKSSDFFANSKLLKSQKLGDVIIRYTNSSTFVELCVTNIGLVRKIRKTMGPWRGVGGGGGSFEEQST